MKKEIKMLSLILVLTLLFTVFTACQSSEKNSGKTNEPSANAGSEEPSEEEPASEKEEKVTLEFVHTRTPQEADLTSESRAFHSNLNKWIADHPNVTINQTTMSQTDYQAKIMALSAADDMPDLFFTKGSWVGTFYKNGVMADLTDHINVEEYREGIFKPFTRDGKIYAVPYQCNVTSLIFYNEDLWKQAGYDKFPDNWDDIFEADKKFKEMGINTFAFGNKDKWNSESCILSALGDRFTGTDWTRSIITNDGKAKFTDPEFIESLKFLQEMSKLFNPDFNAITHQQAATYYLNGKAAANIDGIWNIGYLIENGSEEVVSKTKASVLPAVEGGKGAAATTSGGPVWSMSVSSKLEGAALEAGIDLTISLFNKEYSQYVMDDSGMPSIHVCEPKNFDALKPISQNVLKLVNTLELVPIYDGEMEASVIEVMNTNLQTLLNGGIEPEELAKLVQTEQDQLK